MKYFFFLSLVLSQFCFGQTSNQNSRVIQATVGKTEQVHSKRRLMYTDSTTTNRNPIKLLFSGLMYAYQNVFSEQISATCTYEISCSEYTKLCIETNGLFLGSIQGFHQLMHCTSGAIDEAKPYMFTVYSTKIHNHVERLH